MNELSLNGKLKSDSASRPMWVCKDGHIFLETFNPYYDSACDFLIAIGDPICRANLIHEYKITQYSLYAAISLGLSTTDILTTLDHFSKTEPLEEELVKLIVDNTERCGKVRLVLKRTRYFLESSYSHVLQELLTYPVIKAARLDNRDTDSSNDSNEMFTNTKRGRVIKASIAKVQAKANQLVETYDKDTGFLVSIDEEGSVTVGETKLDQKAAMGIVKKNQQNNNQHHNTKSKVFLIEIDARAIEDVRRVCKEKNFPLLEEYDFKHDIDTETLPIALKPSTTIRPYQEKSLSKMFGNGRARSGIIVLPCGAGKTLVGITAAQTIKKSTLVFCTSVVAVEQWRNQFLLWTNLDPKYIYEFTRDKKGYKFNTDVLVMITTYNMFAAGGKRSGTSLDTLNFIRSHEWGLLLLDEVQVAPATTFRKVMSETHARTKLGLTATLVREDDKIEILYYMLGPKLYEANWLDLQKAGYIATVQCVQVWCPMTAEFYADYLKAEMSKNRQRLLYVNNPNKFRACQYLIELHEKRGDKILVFSDMRFALRQYAKILGKPFINGDTTIDERRKFLKYFQHDSRINTLFISKIGDNSIDLPDVNVIIQISSHFSSRRQEAQRLGRILRPKNKSSGRFNAFFYTLISLDTTEMKYAFKRQRFLADQGYAFKIVKDIMSIAKHDPVIYNRLKFQTKREQLQLLGQIRASNDDVGAVDGAEDFDDQDDVGNLGDNDMLFNLSNVLNNGPNSNITSLSGGQDRIYGEFNREVPEGYEPAVIGGPVKKLKMMKKKKITHTLFKQRQRELDERDDTIG